MKSETPISIGSYTFSNCANATLYVPQGSKAAYEGADYWKEFKEIIEVDPRSGQTLALEELPAMTWGDAAYELPTATAEGNALTWESGDASVATITNGAISPRKAGTVTITATQAGTEDYKPFTREYTLTIAKAPLTITAEDAQMVQGADIPAFSLRYDGFVYDDDASALTAQAVATTTATASSPAGTYPITVSGAASDNYDITCVNGTLTVKNNPLLANVLGSKDIGGLRGTSVVLPVLLTNEDEMTALQFDITLPEGVSVGTSEKGKLLVSKTERCPDHTLSASKQAEGNTYRVLLYSVDVESIDGNSGAVVNVTLDLDEDMEAGEYEITISNINLTTTGQTKLTPADATCTLTVRDYITGDANGDGAVDVTDIVAIANHILGQGSHAVNTYAADVNGDGVIDVTDIVGVANLILNGNSAKARQLAGELMPQ